MSGVAILGRGAPLWLAAAALRRALAPAGVEIDAVALPDDAAPGDLYPTWPAIEALHDQIGIDEAALLRGARGAFTLGRNIVDRSGAEQPPLLLAHGGYGTRIEGEDFFPHWVKARHHRLGVGLDDFSLTASAAHQGRLFLPDEASARYGRADYGYHLPAAGYAKSLKAIARHLGVRIAETQTVDVERGEAGVAALRIDDGTRIAAALFVDATREGVVLREGLGEAFVPWAAPGDRMLTARAPRLASVPAYAEVRAGAEGWTALYPGLTHLHVAHVWSSAAASDEEALEAASAASGLALEAPAVRTVAPGFVHEPWTANVVGVGEAAAGFDPLHGFALHALQLGLVHLIACFPAGGAMEARRAEYNRQMAMHIARVRDFEAAHFVLQRHAGPFWDAARRVPLSPELDHLIALFRARGEIAPQEGESLPPDAWRALFTGLGVVPEGWRPAADRLPPDVAKAHFRKMLGFVREQVLRQPTHDAYLARIAQASRG
ncbi:tryptophan 7-halogenase [Sphingopyxis sp. GW247-27LB]|uniref:tryptophan 7-halogenase n=1 Tax=Sphingopyxis sp. GW247-27LB TaxID=2012632 RepID=UPI000BA5FFCD|nr:tryptophan 7-halogenase [Sphingopyxis sp. GW247-27LB]PAL25622.1 tryptophan halogenase [Sphingopyxis sp. GW247-27LB]